MSGLMNAQQAATSPCPLFGIIATLMRSSKERDGGVIAQAPCGGPMCPMFRWYDSANVVVTVNPTKRPDRRGYCGIAGRPEHES